MSKMERILSKVCDIIYSISKYMLLFITIAIILAVTVNVFCRYLLSMGFFWVEELCRYGLVWATFLGAACGYRRHELIAMTMIIRFFRSQTVWKIGLSCELLILVFFAFAFSYGIKVTTMVINQTSPGMQISMAVPYTILPTGFLIMMLFNIDNILRYIIKKEEYAYVQTQEKLS